jgi:hypothetical protein
MVKAELKKNMALAFAGTPENEHQMQQTPKLGFHCIKGGTSIEEHVGNKLNLT